MEYTSPKQFGEEHGITFEPKLTFELHPHPTERFTVTVERGSWPTFSHLECWRTEELGTAGIYDADEDAKLFADEFVEKFCDWLSPHQMQILIAAMQKSYDAWETRRVAYIASQETKPA